MKKFKKFLNGIIIAVMMATTLAITPIVNGADEIDPYTNLTYEEWGITSCKTDVIGELYVPDTVLTNKIHFVYPGAFKDIEGITKISLGLYIKGLRAGAFENLPNLEYLEVTSDFIDPEYPGYIDEGVFVNCPKLTIYCQKGSMLWDYAESHDIPVKQIEREQYSLIYDRQDGEDLVVRQHLERTSVTVTLNLDDQPGLYFYGWEDKDGNQYKVNTSFTMPAHDVYLTPVWLQEYTVTYVSPQADYITSAVSTSQKKFEKIPFDLQLGNIFTGLGWEVKEWACDVDGKTYSPGATFSMPSSNVTFTAVWSPVNYSFTFYRNFENADKTKITAKGNVQDGLILPENAWEREDFTFVGWIFGTKDTKVYKPGETYAVTGLKAGQSQGTWKAVWEAGGSPSTGTTQGTSSTTNSGTITTTAPTNTSSETKTTFAPDPSVSYGDIDGNSIVNLSDIVLFSKFLSSKYTFTAEQKKKADVNNDGVVNVVDLIEIIRFVFGEKSTING